MTATMTTNADECRESLAPLYRRYGGQTQPQPAYIEIDPEKHILTADYNGEIGNAVPEGVWSRRRLRVRISPYVKGEAVADLMEDERFQSLAQRICDGHSVEWDGHNHVGRLTPDAQDALEALERYIEQQVEDGSDACIEVYEPDQWVSSSEAGDIGLTAETSDAELTKMAKDQVAEAQSQGIYIDGDMLEWLTHLRNKLRQS
ncbi:MAG: hypothetical protein AB1760_00200 [Pseudomonadota bacterium]